MEINIPQAKAIAWILANGKFLKDVVTTKQSLFTEEVSSLSVGSSLLIKDRIPPKMNDPGIFSIHALSGTSRLRMHFAIQGRTSTLCLILF